MKRDLREKGFNHSPYSDIAPGRTQHTPSKISYLIWLKTQGAGVKKSLITAWRFSLATRFSTT